MDDDRPIHVNDLHDVIDQKITALVQEMAATTWSTEEIILAINDVVKARWLDRLHVLEHKVIEHKSAPDEFISDGNEG